jgi:pilus assembly protein FimV
MTRHLLPAASPSAARPPLPSNGWRLSILGAAAAVALGIASTDASAFALGQLKVQSALGEPLRAEIDVTEIAASEAEGLKINIATAEAFKSAGVPYNSALSDVKATLQRRAGGQYVVRLSGNRPLNDPFIDLLLEANGSSGRIVRDYTVLLDPPSHAPGGRKHTGEHAHRTPDRTPVERPVSAARAAASVPRRWRPRLRARQPQHRPRPPQPRPPSLQPHRPAPAAVAANRSPCSAATPPARSPAPTSRPTCRSTRCWWRCCWPTPMHSSAATSTACAPARCSTCPAPPKRPPCRPRKRAAPSPRKAAISAATASAWPRTPPRRMLRPPSRKASGKLQANVEDRNAAASAPDKLTISQGSASTRAADEKVAQARQAQDSNNRVAELSKNINELNKLKSDRCGTGAAAPAAAAPAPATPGIPVPAPSTSATTTPAAASPAPAAAAPRAAPAARCPLQQRPPQPLRPPRRREAVAAALRSCGARRRSRRHPQCTTRLPPTPQPRRSCSRSARGTQARTEEGRCTAAAPAGTHFLEELLDNPLMLAGGALIALLIGFLLYRVLGRRREEMSESVFLESRIPKDSFFGASGGESVDTKNRGDSTVSSLSYSPSQLDAGDVDPVAEADVYLAYGRDLQAEEILREALRLNPDRTAIHLKLLEIHAKRRDVRAYESLATEVHKLTGGLGSDWNRVVDMGKDLDPGNPLYESGTSRSGSAAPPKRPPLPARWPRPPNRWPAARLPRRSPPHRPPSCLRSHRWTSTST